MIWGYHHFRNPPTYSLPDLWFAPETSTSSGSIKSLPPVNFEEIWGEGALFFWSSVVFLRSKMLMVWSWWGGSMVSWMWCPPYSNFTADYRSSIFWRWLGDLAFTLGHAFENVWMDRRCLWSWHRGCWGVIAGGAGRNERKNWQKTSWILIFRNGVFFDSFFLFSCSFLMLSNWRLRIDGKRLWDPYHPMSWYILPTFWLVFDGFWW